MKVKFGKLAVLGAVLAVSASFASADTIQLGSFATGAANMGDANTAMSYVGEQTYATVAAIPSPPGAFTTPSSPTTFALNPLTPVWNAALSNSTWVGIATTAGPQNTSNPAFGYYEFTTSFTANGGSGYAGSMNVQADDTAEVILDAGTADQDMLFNFGALGSDTHCASSGPSCSAPDNLSLSNIALLAGTNTLTFIVEQAGLGPAGGSNDPSGADFDASLTSPTAITPEPSSLILLGTCLLGAGMLVRKRLTA